MNELSVRRGALAPQHRDSGQRRRTWDARRLKFVAEIVMGQSPSSDDYTEDPVDLAFLQGNAEFGRESPTPKWRCNSAPKRVRPGTLLISVRAPVGALNVADQVYGIGRGLCGVLPKSNVLSAEYAWYLLHVIRDDLSALATGSTYEAVTAADVGNLLALLPPLSEQRAIATFLDRETARIDTLIEKKRRLIELLQEKRAAVRTHAVTKGTKERVELTQARIAAIGHVPRHWKFKRLKHVSPRLMVGVVVNPSTFVSDTGKPFLVGSNIKEGEIRWREAAKIDEAGNRANSKSILCKGDLVTVRVGAPGVTAVVPAEVDGGNAASVMIIRGHKTFDSRWLCHVMNSRIVRSQIEVVQYGAAQEQFNISHAVDFWIPVPPIEEQRAIADFVDVRFDKIERLLSRLIKTVELLSEERAALISAGVTGQIDVREAA